MNPSRRGFTLIELLVVIAIIAILIGLLVPAVQRVREAAARIQCGNNLKQLGIALHSYHDSYAGLPAGVTSKRQGEPFGRMTWLARLLPYVEQDTLWKATLAAYDFQPVPYVDPPHIGFSMPIRVFSCPSDPRAFDQHTTHKARIVALTSYVGVLGTAYDYTDGVLFRDSHVRLTDITDGTSNTAMAGERPPSADFWYGWWYAGFGQAGTGSADMLLGARERNFGGPFVSACPPGPYHFQAGSLNEQCDLFHFWSTHPGGAQFLFADGSVLFLSYAADNVLPALATRAGGEVVNLP
jgi:prepilin-type N-terminal cleavage/methylation domain-containing protein/prepilin-type processing-associated H-X9-DG protein